MKLFTDTLRLGEYEIRARKPVNALVLATVYVLSALWLVFMAVCVVVVLLAKPFRKL